MVVDGIVVDVVVLVVDVVVVDEVTATVADSSAGTGFCQTERGVGAPMLGKSVSRMAYAVPDDPIRAVAATTATTVRLVLERLVPAPGPSVMVFAGGCAELTGASDCPSPCPRSSQLSLM